MGNLHFEQNVFYKTNSSAIDINSVQTWADPMNLDNVYIYNNVIDGGVGNGASAILIENDGSHGDVDGVFVRNNLFLNWARCVGFFPDPVTISGNFFDHNMKDTGVTDYVGSNGAATFTIANNLSASPGILATGNRWTNYYKPSNGTSNLVDAGVNVGLAFFGAAPDIGAFEFGMTASSSILSPGVMMAKGRWPRILGLSPIFVAR